MARTVSNQRYDAPTAPERRTGELMLRYGITHQHHTVGHALIVLIACLLLFASPALALNQLERDQATRRQQTVHGRVIVADGSLADDLFIELLEHGSPLDRMPVAHDGTFEFRYLSRPSDEIRVVSFRGEVLLAQFLNGSAYLSEIELRLPAMPHTRPATGTVSLLSLKPVPRNIRNHLKRAQRASAAGDYRQAAECLQRALLACPDCMQVHNDLGTIYMRSGNFDQAAAAFRRAVELDPNSALVQNNLAIALVAIKEYDSATLAARSALRLDPASAPARYALGLVSLGRNECTPEALEHLKTAAVVFPRAFLSLAQLRVCRGDIPGAIQELQSYLKQPYAPERNYAEAWRAVLSDQLK